jgi:hypothetical protein
MAEKKLGQNGLALASRALNPKKRRPFAVFPGYKLRVIQEPAECIGCWVGDLVLAEGGVVWSTE